MTLTPEFQKIADTHQQLRSHTCFQMGPELALKFAGILSDQDYPYQHQTKWDERGYEPYAMPFENDQWIVQWAESGFDCPYAGMAALFQNELNEKRYPIVSLLPDGQSDFHSYVVVAPIGSDDFLLVSKRGSLQAPPCTTEIDLLRSRIQNRLRVGYLIWTANKKQRPQSPPTASSTIL